MGIGMKIGMVIMMIEIGRMIEIIIEIGRNLKMGFAVYTFAGQRFLLLGNTETVDQVGRQDFSFVYFEHLEDFDDFHLFWVRSVHFIFPYYFFIRSTESIVDFLLLSADLFIQSGVMIHSIVTVWFSIPNGDVVVELSGHVELRVEVAVEIGLSPFAHPWTFFDDFKSFDNVEDDWLEELFRFSSHFSVYFLHCSN